MRLIDAEPLIEYFERCRIERIDFDPDGSFAYLMAKQAVKEEVTAEAIPIEWLEEQAKDTTYQHRVDGLIERWRREHGEAY